MAITPTANIVSVRSRTAASARVATISFGAEVTLAVATHAKIMPDP
jgi:hypothetical protein